MNVKGLVSVIVPTYNRAYCLARTLESALCQTYPNIEILLVDDGSTDDTAEMVMRKFGQEPRLRYLFQENRGVSAARNRGLQYARGEFIAFLDSDDIWEPWKLELQVSAMRFAPDICMVWTDMAAVDPCGAVVSTEYLKTMYRAYRYFSRNELFRQAFSLKKVAPALAPQFGPSMLYVGNIFSKMIMGNMVHTSTVLVRSKIIESIKGFNEELKISGEDYDFHLRTCREGPVGFIDVSSIKYQIGMADQLTHSSRSIYMAQNFLRTIEPFIKNQRDRIELPENMISTVLAYAYQWIGKEFLRRGSRDEAAVYFRKSLSCKPLSLITIVLLMLAVMPRPVADASMKAYRTVKKIVISFVSMRMSR